jgi:hypothetical protein
VQAAPGADRGARRSGRCSVEIREGALMAGWAIAAMLVYFFA